MPHKIRFLSLLFFYFISIFIQGAGSITNAANNNMALDQLPAIHSLSDQEAKEAADFIIHRYGNHKVFTKQELEEEIAKLAGEIASFARESINIQSFPYRDNHLFSLSKEIQLRFLSFYWITCDMHKPNYHKSLRDWAPRPLKLGIAIGAVPLAVLTAQLLNGNHPGLTPYIIGAALPVVLGFYFTGDRISRSFDDPDTTAREAVNSTKIWHLMKYLKQFALELKRNSIVVPSLFDLKSFLTWISDTHNQFLHSRPKVVAECNRLLSSTNRDQMVRVEAIEDSANTGEELDFDINEDTDVGRDKFPR